MTAFQQVRRFALAIGCLLAAVPSSGLKADFLSVHPADLQFNGGKTYSISQGSLVNFGFTVGHPNDCFFAGLQLPDLARMSSFGVWYTRGKPPDPPVCPPEFCDEHPRTVSKDLERPPSATLFRLDLNTGEIDDLSTLDLRGPSQLRQRIEEPIPENSRLFTVKNKFYSYALAICMLDGDAFHGARIRYEAPAPD